MVLRKRRRVTCKKVRLHDQIPKMEPISTNEVVGVFNTWPLNPGSTTNGHGPGRLFSQGMGSLSWTTMPTPMMLMIDGELDYHQNYS